MLFTSARFVILVLITFALFYTPALRRAQTVLLIVSSLVFYLVNSYEANQTEYVILLVASITINAFCSHRTFFSTTLKQARFWATLGVVANLAILASFKYAGLLGHTLPTAWTNEVGPAHFLLMITLPVGISFFTFEGISLLVDTFKARDAKDFFGTPLDAPRRHHVLSTTLFISFFPHLVAGPILKAHDFFPQIKPKYLPDIDWLFCFRKIVIGYFLKMVIADNLSSQTFWIQYPYFMWFGGKELLVLLFGYSMQIFADFAGYSLIAIGIAGLFGYRFPENFNFPYISRSFSEFWQRWHISLSSWLKEYLYIPLGGNRKGPVRTYVNLIIVMFLGGLWHGAAWSYAIWGTTHGVALALERFFKGRVKLPDNAIASALKMLAVFFVVTLAWLLFKLPDFRDVIRYVNAIGTNWSGNVDLPRVYNVLIFSLPVVLYHLAYLALQNTPLKTSPAWPKVQRWGVPVSYGVMMFLIVVNSGISGDFIYFQF